MRLGVPELILVVLPLFLLFVGGGAFLLFSVLSRRRARRFGFDSTSAYLRAAPRSDPEKRDAADLALTGLILCLLGLLFAPFVLVGLIPLYYGGRKLLYASMGLGLVDDAERRRV